jgi:hypothetical protein
MATTILTTISLPTATLTGIKSVGLERNVFLLFAHIYVTVITHHTCNATIPATLTISILRS